MLIQEGWAKTEPFQVDGCQAMTRGAACADTTTDTTTTTTTTTAAAATAGNALMCAPILNADGNVIAVCLLSNKLPSTEHSGGFTNHDEKVKGAFSLADNLRPT